MIVLYIALYIALFDFVIALYIALRGTCREYTLVYGSTRWRRHVHERVPCKMPDKSSLKPLWADSVSKMVPERGLESPAKPQLKSSMVLCLKHSFSPGWGKKGAAGQPRLTLLHPSLFQPTNHSASQTMRSKLCASCFGSESQNTIKFWQVFWWWWSHSALATKTQVTQFLWPPVNLWSLLVLLEL